MDNRKTSSQGMRHSSQQMKHIPPHPFFLMFVGELVDDFNFSEIMPDWTRARFSTIDYTWRVHDRQWSSMRHAHPHRTPLHQGLRRWFVPHAYAFQCICPLAARPCMAVLEMLSEVICSVEPFALVALSKLVYMANVISSRRPISRVGEFVATEPANISAASVGSTRVKRAFDACQCGARPRVAPQMKRVLMPFSFVLVLEPIRTVRATVLLFHEM